MSTTTSGKIKTSIAIDPETHTWLTAHATGWRGIGDLIEKLVRERRLVEGLEQRIEQLITKEKNDV
jgi:hypothetical protein